MNTASRSSARQRGFTLIEALISLAIFSFIGVGAYQLLSSTSALQQTGQHRYRQVSGLQLALRLLEEDFSQLSPRPVSGSAGPLDPPLTSSPADAIVELTRSGWRNPLARPRSRLQRVAWEIDEEGDLLRRYWPELDNRSGNQSVARTVASDIESMAIRFLDAGGKWTTDWPPPESAAQVGGETTALPELLPAAVEIRLLHKQMGEVVRVVPVH